MQADRRIRSDKLEELESEIQHPNGFAVKAHRLQITAKLREFRKNWNL